MKTRISLIEGDAETVMSTLEDNSFDVIVTSPPYNIGVDYGDGVSDDMPRVDYLNKFSIGWLKQAARVLSKDEGHLFLNVGGTLKDPMLPFQIVPVAIEAGFRLQNVIHWIKSVSFVDKDGKTVSRGHFKPIHSSRYLNDLHEYVLHLTPTGSSHIDRLSVGVPYQDKSNVSRWAGKVDKRCRGNVWMIPYKTIRSAEKQRNHPATFPVELPEMCLKMAGADQRPLRVLDPFVGTGSTLEAARGLGAASAVGIDLQPNFLEACSERLDVR